MELFLLIIRLVLFGVFATAGATKSLDLDGSEKAMRDFGVPAAFARVFGILLPAAEIAVALSLLFVSFAWFGSIAAAGLLALFTSVMVYQSAKGNAPDCHCLGQIHSEPI
ncbi:MAG: DoxX family protein, partial [Acidobacteria bacterium]|nr:DoxX family protein [Acidobacteriota bacterium]